jgi:fido (protein-threonine AMPylation protein)
MNRPIKGKKRGSLSNIFSDFASVSSASSHSLTKLDLGTSLRSTFSKCWPPGSMRGGAPPEVAPGYFTIRMTGVYRQSTAAPDAKTRYEQAVECIRNIQARCGKDGTGSGEWMVKQTQEDLMATIFGSNSIEEVGGTERITLQICRDIFAGKTFAAGEIDNRDPEYAAELEYQANLGRDREKSSVIRGRYEIMQHAKAAKLLVDSIVARNESLTEDLIKEAHHILAQHTDGAPNAGKYRTSAEGARWGRREETNQEYEARVQQIKKYKPDRLPERNKDKPIFEATFAPWKSVPILMKKLVEQYNHDMAAAEKTGEIDAMDLAAKYCYYFVSIHPFEDGNGRLCRLLMNVILLKYAGVCIEVASGPDENYEWQKMSNAANKAFRLEADDVEWGQHTGHATMSAMVVRKTQEKLAKLWASIPK